MSSAISLPPLPPLETPLELTPPPTTTPEPRPGLVERLLRDERGGVLGLSQQEQDLLTRLRRRPQDRERLRREETTLLQEAGRRIYGR